MTTGIVAAVLVIGTFFYFHRRPKLTEKDTIVLADFDNRTGEAVFDDTLKQVLAVDLEQSPFLNILSDLKVSETLRLMGRQPGERLAQDIARELCQRTGSKAMVGGSIANLGKEYVVGLNAVNCQTGDRLVQEQVRTNGKDDILKGLDRAASDLRGKLGESLASVQKFHTPLEEATTPSIEALKSFTSGEALFNKGLPRDAIPFYQHALDLDPNFALAYARLGTIYGGMFEEQQEITYKTRAFELKDRAGTRKNFEIVKCLRNPLITASQRS